MQLGDPVIGPKTMEPWTGKYLLEGHNRFGPTPSTKTCNGLPNRVALIAIWRNV